MHTLNIVGCGNVGQTLAKALRANGLVGQVAILNRSEESSRKAQNFIGDCSLAVTLAQLPSASLWMIATPDSAFAEISAALRELPALRPNDIVFHCSGASDCSIFHPLKGRGALLASIHPIRSFAEPALAYAEFPNTVCTLEGDAAARSVLKPLFEKIGANVFEISSQAKLLSHIGHVFASNYLVAVVDLAQRIYVRAGIEENLATLFMRSLSQSALSNLSNRGTTQALTGPVSRGDVALVNSHLIALQNLADSELLSAYTTLGRVALDIAERRGDLDASTILELRRSLCSTK
jgi:predicted short-subunit dehydrogenase-like oxidoreductase (DUF2520 family)